MTFTLTPLLEPSPSLPPRRQVHISLAGLQWSTFQAMVAELEPSASLELSYSTAGATISQQSNHDSDLAQVVFLRGLSWQTYRAILQDIGDERSWRIAFNQGELEIRMPSTPHEEAKRMLEDFITVIVDELELEARSLGSLTLEQEALQRAVEPDSCFYIQNEAQVRSKKNIRLSEDPPPDLAIEADYTNSSLNKYEIYAAIGVPEIWRYRSQQLEVYILSQGAYHRTEKSLAFPFLPLAEVPDFIEKSREIGQRKAVRLFRRRIQQVLDADAVI
ncbi:MAG: Uma2 family endonuclease [Cyanobacteria bacterium P01_A01_bin.105]